MAIYLCQSQFLCYLYVLLIFDSGGVHISRFLLSFRSCSFVASLFPDRFNISVANITSFMPVTYSRLCVSVSYIALYKVVL